MWSSFFSSSQTGQLSSIAHVSVDGVFGIWRPATMFDSENQWHNVSVRLPFRSVGGEEEDSLALLVQRDVSSKGDGHPIFYVTTSEGRVFMIQEIEVCFLLSQFFLFFLFFFAFFFILLFRYHRVRFTALSILFHPLPLFCRSLEEKSHIWRSRNSHSLPSVLLLLPLPHLLLLLQVIFLRMVDHGRRRRRDFPVVMSLRAAEVGCGAV